MAFENNFMQWALNNLESLPFKSYRLSWEYMQDNQRASHAPLLSAFRIVSYKHRTPAIRRSLPVSSWATHPIDAPPSSQTASSKFNLTMPDGGGLQHNHWAPEGPLLPRQDFTTNLSVTCFLICWQTTWTDHWLARKSICSFASKSPKMCTI